MPSMEDPITGPGLRINVFYLKVKRLIHRRLLYKYPFNT